MTMSRWKSLVPVFVFLLFMAYAGSALAYQYSAAYPSGTVWPTQNWSPTQGYLFGNVSQNNVGRWVNADGIHVRWNGTAINWIRNNGNHVSITTHAFQHSNNGCSSFTAIGGSSDLPGPRTDKHIRQCWSSGRPTEIRLVATNSAGLSSTYYYSGYAYYEDTNATAARQMITIDTYYGGSSNFHQKFCIAANSFTAVSCP